MDKTGPKIAFAIIFFLLLLTCTPNLAPTETLEGNISEKI